MSSKKKWLIGCGVVLLVAILTVVGFLGFVTYKFASFGQKMTAGLTQIESTNDKHTFNRPAGDVLDAQRMQVYFDIRASVVTSAMDNPVFKKMQANDRNNPPGVMEIISAVLDFMEKGIYEFSAQLDQNNMSLNEYRYYSLMTYLAVQRGRDAGDAAMSEIATKWDTEFQRMNGELGKNPNAQGVTVDENTVEDGLNGVVDPFPAENYPIVATHKDDLIKNSMGSFFEVFGSLILDKKVQQMKQQGTPMKVKPMPTPEPAIP